MAPGAAYGPAGSLGTSAVAPRREDPVADADADADEDDAVAAGDPVGAAPDPQAGDAAGLPDGSAGGSVDVAAGPSVDVAPPMIAGPAGAMAPAGPAAMPPGIPGVAEASGLPPTAGDPMASVSDAEIDAALAGYGQWMQTDDYGPVWSPDATGVGVDFTPYESGGSWAYTDAGWSFAAEYPWGWLPFHYGRWGWLNDRWCWVPGHRWGAAWVQWRHGGGVVGWRPTPPRMRGPGQIRPGLHGDPIIRDHRHAEVHDAHWRFARVSEFAKPHVRAHLFGNIAEGLRVTSTVKAPPIRARAPIPAAEVMRNRFTTVSRAQPSRAQPSRDQPGRAQPGRIGTGVELRDHRVPLGVPPGIPQSTSRDAPQTVRPAPSSTAGSFGAYRAPAQTYRPPVQTYRPPVQTYRPPVQTYRPPVQTYRPPVQTYRPPVYSGQPAPYRPSQPPAGTFQPGTPPPSQAWSPPAHSWSPPASAPHPSAPAPSAPHPSAPPSAPHAAPVRVR